MSDDIILSDAELIRMTKKKQPAAQKRVLDALKVPWKPRPDGSIVVWRSAAERAGMGVLEAANDPGAQSYDVDVGALRARHGAKARAR
jgi:hypothetical protein